jgi:hypothetical protein
MTRKLSYRFDLDNGTVWRYDLEFDEHNRFVLKSNPEAAPREWTKLEFQQCPHCPLRSDESPCCPVARNIDQIVEDSKSALSYTRAEITVETPERTYSKKTDTQDGLRSIFGLIMAASGCPYLDWFRPLARFHLPFADVDETLFRFLSVQLVEHLLEGGANNNSEALVKIGERCRMVEKVNQSFVKRIRAYCSADADKNALAALDVFIQLFPYHVEENFGALRPLFQSPELS